MTILVTGDAGFIGFHLSKRLLQEGIKVIGFDNLNPYYDPLLKKARREELIKLSKKNGVEYIPVQSELSDSNSVNNIFNLYKPSKVVNLAAQAGVRYSIENPSAYIQSNLVGFSNILEACRENEVQNLIYASSSSVYGGNTYMPFTEKKAVDHPVSLYAATKKSNELMAHAYSHLYGVPAIGLRFFTVYGPWGRPDMALFLFTKAILSNEPIKIFNDGKMIRDFTYIDDIIESLLRLLSKPAIPDFNFDTNLPDPSSSWAAHRIFNIGNSSPTPLMEYVKAIEDYLGIVAKKEYLPMQKGDVKATSADTSSLEEWIGFKPNTSIKKGVSQFLDWYKKFYQ